MLGLVWVFNLVIGMTVMLIGSDVGGRCWVWIAKPCRDLRYFRGSERRLWGDD